ncbi:MAG: hypothetical protein COX30_04685 [Candidatus Moranbacteria bacterium CG23_combo_of_CG06-09_8_20_14_all_39_10]|nr:MAG: hypothetical protein COX30_04685 [Candidatus Moranbacteria bacterium CG23_combo_of_CG06-09_8_20_14_all_39_10]
MGLMEKIEEIRRKPEHIRMRFVWLCVAVSMLFILTIWVFSFQAGDKTETSSLIPTEEINNIADQFNDQKKSLQATFDNTKNAVNQDAATRMQDGTAPQNLNR